MAYAGLATRLDGLSLDIQQLFEYIRRHRNSMSAESSDGNDFRIMNNLEECVLSAGNFVSTASTIAENSTVAGGSVLGDGLTEEQKTRIVNWIVHPPVDEEDPNAEESASHEFNDYSDNAVSEYHKVEPVSSVSNRPPSEKPGEDEAKQVSHQRPGPLSGGGLQPSASITTVSESSTGSI